MVSIQLRHPNGTNDVMVSPRKDVFNMTQNVPALPIAVVGDDSVFPPIVVTLTQIVAAVDDAVRILAPTSPGKDEVTTDEHTIELGYVTVRDAQGN